MRWDNYNTTVKHRYNKLSSGSLLFGRYTRDVILTVNVSIVNSQFGLEIFFFF